MQHRGVVTTSGNEPETGPGKRKAILGGRLNLVRGEKPRADRSVADPEARGDLSQALTLSLQLENPLAINRAPRATELLAICPRISKPGIYPFPYQISLKPSCPLIQPLISGRLNIADHRFLISSSVVCSTRVATVQTCPSRVHYPSNPITP